MGLGFTLGWNCRYPRTVNHHLLRRWRWCGRQSSSCPPCCRGGRAGKLLQVRCRSSSTGIPVRKQKPPNRNLQKRRRGSSRAGKPALPKNLIPRLPVQVRLTGEVSEACYRSSLCAQGTPVGDADEQLNAQMLRRGGRGRVGSSPRRTGAPPL